MDCVVDAGVQGMPAAQTLAVGGIGNLVELGDAPFGMDGDASGGDAVANHDAVGLVKQKTA